MAIKKRGPAAALTASTTQSLGTISLGAAYGRVLGFSARNYSSSAKTAAGTDALMEVKLTDAEGRVIYLDAADRDYKTALVTIFFQQDETATGLSDLKLDATGAALSSQGTSVGAIAASPVTVTALNGATATDYFEVYLYVEV